MYLPRWQGLEGHSIQILVARASGAMSQFGIFWLLGRYAGPGALANYATGLALGAICGVALDSGVAGYFARTVSSDGSVAIDPRPWLKISVGVFGIGGLASLAVMPGRLSLVAVMATACALASRSASRGLLWGQLLHHREAPLFVLEQIGSLAVVYLFTQHSASGFATLIAVALTILAASSARLFVVDWARRPIRFESRSVRWWLAQVAPYGAQSLSTSALTQIDLVLLPTLWIAADQTGVAAYALALKFYYIVSLPFEAFSVALMPRVAYTRSPPFGKAARMWSLLGPASSILVGFVVYVGSTKLFAPPLGEALRALWWMPAAAALIRPGIYMSGAMLTALGWQRTRLALVFSSLVMLLALDAIAMPHWGPPGAAVALLLTDAGLLSGQASILRRRVRQGHIPSSHGV